MSNRPPNALRAAPEEEWDRAIASALSRANTPASGSASASRCHPLRPRAATDESRALPGTTRTLAAISSDARCVLRELVAGRRPWPLFLHGPAGRGKTCLALCLLDFAGGDYWTTSALLDRIIAIGAGRVVEHLAPGSGSRTLTAEDHWERLKRRPLVVLDEMGSRRVSDFAYEATLRLIDLRQAAPLVCIANHPLDRIEELYDDRVADRLAAGTVLELTGPSRRIARP